jgi:hypothetical protein
MYCQRCGAVLPGGANFCPNCGAPAHPSAAAFPTQPVQRPAPVPAFETCVINLRWQDGPGFVPAVFEADVNGPGGQYIAGQSTSFNIIPGNPFWLGTQEVHAAHAALVTFLTGAGWQAIGQATADWWTAEFRRQL